jgi:DNA-directed RNA polymerase sigma subunit (sigma70/sigma32)
MKEHTCPNCGRVFSDPPRKISRSELWLQTILRARADLQAIRAMTAYSWRIFDGETYREIGRRLGVKSERAKQLSQKGLRQTSSIARRLQ